MVKEKEEVIEEIKEIEELPLVLPPVEPIEPIKLTKPVPTVDTAPQYVSVTETPLKGTLTESVRTMKEDERNILEKVKPSAPSDQAEIFEKETPLAVLKQVFCYNEDYLIIFVVEDTVHVFAFRGSVSGDK